MSPTRNEGWLEAFFLAAITLIEKAPRWLKAPLLGAFVLTVWTSFNLIFGLLASGGHATNVSSLILVFPVAALAGAFTGIVFNIIRPVFKHLRFVGDLLTGLILGCSLTAAILVEGKFLWGEDYLATSTHRMIASLVGVAVGLIGTILYWNEWYWRKN